jgi:hypothetical protein
MDRDQRCLIPSQTSQRVQTHVSQMDRQSGPYHSQNRNTGHCVAVVTAIMLQLSWSSHHSCCSCHNCYVAVIAVVVVVVLWLLQYIVVVVVVASLSLLLSHRGHCCCRVMVVVVAASWLSWSLHRGYGCHGHHVAVVMVIASQSSGSLGLLCCSYCGCHSHCVVVIMVIKSWSSWLLGHGCCSHWVVIVIVVVW